MIPALMSGRGGRLALAVVLSAFALIGCSSRGKAKEPAKLGRIEHPQLRPESTWTRHVGAGSEGYYSGYRLALAGDALFAAALDGRVYAFNPVNGDIIWRSNTKARVISGPSIVGDKVLVGTLDGEVIALHRADGKPAWRAAAPAEALAPPAGDGDIVVAKAQDGRQYGLDASTGERKWVFDRNEPSLTLRGLSAPLISGGRVYLGMDNGKLAVLNLNDGQMVWEQTISVPTGRGDLDRLTDIDADLLLGDAGLYVVTYGGDIALINLGSGDSRWRRSVKSYSGMVLGGDKLFVTDDDGVVWALDAESGAAAWKQEGLKYRHLSPPVFFKGYVVVGDYKGYLHWLSPEDGKIVARTRLGHSPITTPPVAGDGLLYVMDVVGRLQAYDVKPPK